MQEVGDELRAVGRMDHLGMEHRGVVAARFVGGDCIGRVLRNRMNAETLRQTGHAVAVAHPHRITAARLPDAVEQGAWGEDLDLRAAELRGMAALHLAPELLAQGLLAVADGENGNPALQDLCRRARASRLREPTPARRKKSPPWA